MSNNLLELLEDMKNSKGGMVLNRVEQFEFSKNLLHGNALDLAKAIAKFNGSDLIFNKTSTNQQHKDLNRYLHNFLASAITLIDHTRIFVKSYYEHTEFQQIYNKKIKTGIAEDPLCKFVQNLRNYILHRGIPFTAIRHQWHHENGEITEISLDRDKLLEWDKWSVPAKTYLAEAPAKIEIKLFLLDYVQKIDELQGWIIDSLKEIHKDDLAEYALLVEEYNRTGLHKSD